MTLQMERGGATPAKRKRRKYKLGKCRDCGWEKPVTTAVFWVNGMRYDVCSECIKAYRSVILKP